MNLRSWTLRSFLDVKEQIVVRAQRVGCRDNARAGGGRTHARDVLVGEGHIDDEAHQPSLIENEQQSVQLIRTQRSIAVHELRPRVQIRPDPYAVEAEVSDQAQVGHHIRGAHCSEVRDEGQKPGRAVDRESIALNREPLSLSLNGREAQADANESEEATCGAPDRAAHDFLRADAARIAGAPAICHCRVQPFSPQRDGRRRAVRRHARLQRTRPCKSVSASPSVGNPIPVVRRVRQRAWRLIPIQQRSGGPVPRVRW